ncbi:MAG: GWxTD domain-containing protein [bacterium]
MRRTLAAVSASLAMALIFGSGVSPQVSTVDLKYEADRLRELIMLHPDSAELHVELSSVYVRLETARGRALALKHMEMATKEEPDNADYHLLLGELYLEGTHWNYGTKQLKKTIELQPRRPYPHFRLGRAHLDRAFEEWQTDQFQEANLSLRRAMRFQPGFVDAATYLALCYLDTGEPDSSVKILERLPSDSLGTDAYLVMGMAYNERGELGSSYEAFSRALSLMPDSQRRRYLSLDVIATGDELRALAKTNPGHMDSVTILLWRKRDPNPATRVNERLVEHLSRVSFSDFHFYVRRLDKPGSLTTRGEVFIRYGRPLNWYYDPFGTNTFAGDVLNPTERLMTTPFTTRFEDYAEQASRYRSSRMGKERPRWMWVYDGFVLNFEDTFLNGDYSFPYEYDWSAYRYAYMEENIPEVYEQDIKKLMKVELVGLSFMEPDGSTRFKIAYACDFNGLVFDREYDWPRGEFVVEGALLDTLYNEVSHFTLTRKIHADSTAIYLTTCPLIDTLNVRVPTGKGVLAISLTSNQNDAVGFTHRDVNVRAFGDSLEISDLELRFDEEGRPNPSRMYETRSKAYIAFEAYNIATGEDGRGRLEVSYVFRRIPERRSRTQRLLSFFARTVGIKPTTEIVSLASGYEMRTDGGTTSQVMGIDLSSLIAGYYEVEVLIKDVETGAVTSQSTELGIASELTL